MEQEFGGTKDIAERGFQYTKEQYDQVKGLTEDYVRANPTRALAYAAGAGLVLHWIPVFSLLRGLGRLVIFAIKPAILIYGATKAYQALQNDEPPGARYP